MKPRWKLTKLKQLQNECSIIELAIENTEVSEDYEHDWMVIGTFFVPDAIYNKLIEEKVINREILVYDKYFEND